MNLTRKQKSNLKWLAEQFSKDYSINMEYIKLEDILNLNLKEIYELHNLKYIKINDKDICIDISKRPLKKGKYLYSAIGYDFINLLLLNGIGVEYEI